MCTIMCTYHTIYVEMFIIQIVCDPQSFFPHHKYTHTHTHTGTYNDENMSMIITVHEVKSTLLCTCSPPQLKHLPTAQWVSLATDYAKQINNNRLPRICRYSYHITFVQLYKRKLAGLLYKI